MSGFDLPPIVLASGSPRRHELLASLGVDFTIVSPDVDESVRAGEAPRAYVERLARAKAAAIPRPDALVIAADTTVVLDDEIIGKPIDRHDARRLLRRLSGRAHVVHTGVAVSLDGHVEAEVVDTAVWFVDLSDADIDWYVATGEPDDKAGAYGMQGTGNVFVAAIDGSPSNVIGLPLATVMALARRLGVDLIAGPSPERGPAA
jgi:septum formation protein